VPIIESRSETVDVVASSRSFLAGTPKTYAAPRPKYAPKLWDISDADGAVKEELFVGVVRDGLEDREHEQLQRPGLSDEGAEGDQKRGRSEVAIDQARHRDRDRVHALAIVDLAEESVREDAQLDANGSDKHREACQASEHRRQYAAPTNHASSGLGVLGHSKEVHAARFEPRPCLLDVLR
jgi:hypothetical protein